MEVKGKVHEVGPTTQVTDSLKKRELILEYIENPQYPEYVKFEAIQDRCNILDNVKVGDDVEVFFNLRGRPWTDKTGKKNAAAKNGVRRAGSGSRRAAGGSMPRR